MNIPAVPASVSRGSLIEARGVFKSFGQTPALRGANVDRRPGRDLRDHGPERFRQVHAAALPGWDLHPGRGGRAVDGQVVNAMSEADWTKLRRTAFGFVFQFGQLVPELTAADNVALPLLLNRTRRKVAYKTADTWLDRLGIGDKGGRRTPVTLRRRGAAGRGRPGARARAEGHLRRRADRVARVADRWRRSWT